MGLLQDVSRLMSSVDRTPSQDAASENRRSLYVFSFELERARRPSSWYQYCHPLLLVDPTNPDHGVGLRGGSGVGGSRAPTPTLEAFV